MSFVKLRNIKRALSLKPNGSVDYLLSGRISNFRRINRSLQFIDLVDGSSRGHMQVIVKRDLLHKPELGSYLTCLGNIVESVGPNQPTEFHVKEIKFISECDPSTYPLANPLALMPRAQNTADSPSFSAYRVFPHLRPRMADFASLLRVRSELELSLSMIMQQMDFIKVPPPTITSNDSEATSDLFTIKRSKIAKNSQEQENVPSDKGDEEVSLNRDGRILRDDYFGSDVFLTTSAQLHLESFAAGLSRVYTLSNAFRAENSISNRHLCEFSMFELEESNLTDLDSLINRAESIIKFAGQFLSEVSQHKSDFNGLKTKNSNQSVFDNLTGPAYIRMSYREALETLRDKTDFAAGDTNYGADIGRLHEKKLLEYCNNVPIFITKYPKNIKPFYMKCDVDDREAQCFDLIAPIGGEICGGSLREDSYDKLVKNLAIRGDDFLNRFSWYLDGSKFGSFPHGGFGIGIERLLQSLLGIKNIRDTVAFPRWAGHCPM